jgi:hypothetical protein
MPNVIEEDSFDPKRIYDDLITRCKTVKEWNIRFILDEAWTGIAPFDMIIEDGIVTARVIAPTLKDAYVRISNSLPVIVFLDFNNKNHGP